jgi:hemolysin activation/secretion protein
LADSQSAQTAGWYDVLRWQLARQQPLGDSGINLSLRFGGQVASKNLDSSEKLYLGGASGVRAYPVSEAGGSSGQLATVELQSKVHQYARLSTFVDWGRVKNRGGHGKGYDLSGVGIALNLIGISGVDVQLAWAHRLGNNPNALPNGNDQDGSLKRNRFWLSAGFIF